MADHPEKDVVVDRTKASSAQNPESSAQAPMDVSNEVGHWDVNIAADRVRADPLAASLFNVDPDLAEAGVPLAAFVAGMHAEDRDRVIALISQCAQRGGSYVAEYRVCSADGVTRWVLARGSFELDGEGLPSRGRGIVVDITPSRRRETAFVASKASPTEHPLERAADQCVAVHRTIAELEDPTLTLLSEMLLLEIGRKLAKLETRSRLKRLN
ncbi:PAS domain-containing protein [Methylobacterium planeticum]|uniref:histidine kinase n=1 Tax=Methylobacterium planeticum TaxID=2615211 RepID=A0A6N6MN13_9HYPH|nr:PAS domain-containing protein [Methylobacterium planeticum]KAB1072642.1 PAS domain-containing protein [Methylobacterium planeticum]